MLIVGLDFETTGLDPVLDRIIEIGAVLWETETRQPVQLYSVLVKHADAPPISAEIQQITGISQAMLDSHGKPPAEAFFGLVELILHGRYLVAHNGSEFDRPMLEAQLARQPVTPKPLPLPAWIDTIIDVPYPEHIATRKLVHLAAEHGFLNPFSHRAVFDVLTMLRILSLYPFAEVEFTSSQPSLTLVAQVSYEDRDKPKRRGYRWKPETRQWIRSVKAHKVEQELAECGFTVIVES